MTVDTAPMAWRSSKLETGLIHEILQKVSETGKVKVKQLSDVRDIYMLTSTQNPDARLILSLDLLMTASDETASKYSIAVGKTITKFLYSIFVNPVQFPNGFSVTNNERPMNTLSALAYIKRKYNVIPMLNISVSPGARGGLVSVSMSGVFVDNLNKLTSKNSYGIKFDNVSKYTAFTATVEKFFNLDGSQKTGVIGVTLRTKPIIAMYKKVKREEQDVYVAFARTGRLLLLLGGLLANFAKDILPVVDQKSNALVVTLDKLGYALNSCVYPDTKFLKVLAKKKIEYVVFIINTNGIKKVLLGYPDRTVKYDESKVRNLNLVSIDYEFGNYVMTMIPHIMETLSKQGASVKE